MLEKITAGDLAGKGVIGLPEVPGLPTEQMQAKFEETAREVIVPKFNALVDKLTADTGAAEIGFSDGKGSEKNVQEALLKLKRETAEAYKSSILAANAAATAQDMADSANSAAVAASLYVKDVDETAVKYTKQAKEPGWQKQARDNIGAVGTSDLEKTVNAALDNTVRYDKTQALTSAQKTVARQNINAVTAEEAVVVSVAAVDEKYFDGVAEVMPETSVVCDEPIGQGAGSGYRSFKGEIDFDGGWIYDEGPKTALVRYEDSAGVQEVECQASYRMFDPGSNWVYYGNEYLLDSGRPNTGEDFLLAFRKGNFKQSNLYSRRNETVKVAVSKKAVNKEYLPRPADAVTYTEQELTDEQKQQARENIGAVSKEDVQEMLEDLPTDGASVDEALKAVEDKYFYEMGETLVPEMTVQCELVNSNGVYYYGGAGERFNAVAEVEPETVVVVVNGEQHKTAVQYTKTTTGEVSWVYIGNRSLSDSSEADTGENFLLSSGVGSGATGIIYSRTAGEMTFSVHMAGNVLADEYLNPLVIKAKAQALSAAMQKQARENIGAVGGKESVEAVEKKFFDLGLAPIYPEETVTTVAGSGPSSSHRSEAELAANGADFYNAQYEKVSVKINGEVVECGVTYWVVDPGSRYASVGNMYLYSRSYPDTGEDFLISYRLANGASVIYTREPGEYTFTVNVAAPVMKPEYLPPMGAADAVTYTAQTLTDEQKAQARENIGAAAVGEGGGEVGDITWDDISVTYGDTLTWDGNTNGLPNVMEAFFKVSDAVPTVADVQKGGSCVVDGERVEVPADAPEEEIVMNGVIFLPVPVAVVPPEMAGVEIDGIMFPEAGTYFGNAAAAGGTVTELQLNGYNGFAIMEKIPQDRLPLGDIGGVANWDAEKGKPGYMLNKPFERVHEVILPETEFQIDPNYGQGVAIATKEPSPGEIYNVVWNGVKYECPVTVVGDGEFIGFAHDVDGVPLFIIGFMQGACVVYAFDGSAFVTLEIYRDYVKKIKREFLPEDLNVSWEDIKDKPFGDELVEILPETEVTPDDDNGTFGALLDYSLFANAGEQLVITFDGVKYPCNKFEPMPGTVAYGNGKFIGAEDTGEPFCLLLVAGSSVAALYTQDTNSHTVSVGNITAKPIDSAFLPESGVTAGKYGSYSGGYYFPIVTVDAYGRITAASEAVIPNVNNGMGDNGLMPYAMYSHIANGSHITHANSTIAVGGEATMILGNCATVLNIFVSGTGYIAFPKVYGAYVYTYTDASKSNRYWVPVDPKYVKYSCSGSGDSMSTTSITVTAVVALPEEYREYYAEGDSVPVLVIYEKVYGSSSSVM